MAVPVREESGDLFLRHEVRASFSREVKETSLPSTTVAIACVGGRIMCMYIYVYHIDICI